MTISKYSNVRLLDVFILGPLQIFISLHVKNKLLKYFLFIIGVSNIIYNGHNYLYLDLNILKKPLSIFSPFINKNYGKTQLQRLFNIFIMYPIFMHILRTTNISNYIKLLFLVQIVFGFTYNLKNFIDIWKNKLNHSK